MPYSSQKGSIISPAIELRSSCTYLEFLSKLSVSPYLSWHCGIALHSCCSVKAKTIKSWWRSLYCDPSAIDTTELLKRWFLLFKLLKWIEMTWIFLFFAARLALDIDRVVTWLLLAKGRVWTRLGRDDAASCGPARPMRCEGVTEGLSACDVQHITSKSGQECDVRCPLSCIEA